MASVEELQKKVQELEAKLAAVQVNAGPARQKIDVMSSEVVDSNPYRYFAFYIFIYCRFFFYAFLNNFTLLIPLFTIVNLPKRYLIWP